jgi:hypothetical protein
MWDLETLKRLNAEREKLLRSQGKEKATLSPRKARPVLPIARSVNGV